MNSMTGYGKGVYHENGIELTVEVKSVNNRYLDLSVKCPRAFLAEEELVRAAVRESITRGHVDVYVSLRDTREKEKSMYLDMDLARAYMEAAEKLSGSLLSLKNDMSVVNVLRFPDVLKQEESSGADDELVTALQKALGAALDAHLEMRHAEGERLKLDLISRMETIETLRARIAARAPLVSEEYRKKLTERITEYLEGKVEETRILTEAALFADKCNIDEELTRLSSHIAEFYKISESETVGRKLDFLVQEFNRECNTVCSKSNDAKITACALEMKNEIEKVREQIQNLE